MELSHQGEMEHSATSSNFGWISGSCQQLKAPTRKEGGGRIASSSCHWLRCQGSPTVFFVVPKGSFHGIKTSGSLLSLHSKPQTLNNLSRPISIRPISSLPRAWLSISSCSWREWGWGRGPHGQLSGASKHALGKQWEHQPLCHTMGACSVLQKHTGKTWRDLWDMQRNHQPRRMTKKSRWLSLQVGQANSTKRDPECFLGVASWGTQTLRMCDSYNKKADIIKCWQRCWETGIIIYCWCECKIAQPLWKTVRQFPTR